MSQADAFAVPGVDWERVSPRLAVVRRILLGLALLVVLVATGALASVGVLAWSWWSAGAAVVVAGSAYGWRLIGIQVRAWGFAERDQDLVLTRGRIWRRLDVVPYGRMQLVDVTVGPLDRVAGLATVRLHTAAPGTGARIPGLTPDVAARLRERLTERGQAQAAGL